MANPTYAPPGRQAHRSRRRLGSAAAVVAVTAMFAASASSDPSAATESSPPVALSEPGPVTFAMAVKPGRPVPMQIVTERSAGQFAGQGATGKGIDVALIDTGVSLVPGLDEPGKVLFGPDLSMEGADPAVANLDRYGHGTHLAGIINGEHGEVLGVAPDSRVVSVKVAGAKGETSLAQVVAGIDWVIEHKNDNGLNIRVLNLSLGVDGVKTNQGDIFSAAVERAWDAGIVVVAATGNRGNGHGGIDSPAISPYVIAAGAIESYDSSGAMDWMAPWSSGGNEYRQPDVVAPGRSILSLRVPGSTLDQMYPTAVVGEQYFVGSGTSQSAAVVSGFAAAMLSRNPALTNDQIKFLFERSAADVVDGDLIDGSGKLEAGQSARYIGSAAKAPVQDHPRAFPDNHDGLVTPSGATWSGGEWNGATWSGGSWSGATWSGATWSGATWSGGSWSGATWSGATWSGATWSAGFWS